ncbi:unnamed protein product [Calicophoron daubneyi]|uniref:Uncharacterized protein n=1 Tax=Calicophoron daubneyi TaxID=300641 RepID=A0AAV2TVC7_CALDB
MTCSESLLECLECVFSEHIMDLVEDVGKRFVLVDTKLKESEEQKKTLDSKIAQMGISLKQIMAEKCDLHEQSEILRNQLNESVPQADHQRALDRMRTLEISLEQNDEVIESLKEQAVCAIEQFRTLHISPASSDLNRYIDAVVEELTISRKTIEHLQYDKQETHALLDASVPKDCYDEIAKLLESSRLELNETHGSLKKLQLELDDISNPLSHVVDVSSDQSLHETVDLVVSKMLEQRSLVEKIDSDHQALMLFIESISNDPLPDTFEECLNVLKAFIFDHQAQVEHLTADRDQILTLLENSGLSAQNDGPLVDRLQSAISVFQ